MTDYNQYKCSNLEILLYGGEWLFLCSMIGWLFYHSVIAVGLLFLFVKVYLNDKKSKKAIKQKKDLNIQFKDAITSLSSALAAGYSVENAFSEVYRDLALIYSKDALIMQEIYHMIRKLEMNETIESLLHDLAKRSGDEDIKNFSEVFFIAKRAGGDFISIIDMTTNSITQKIEVKREIDVLLASKKLEQKIMNLIPMFIIFYVGLTSKGYFQALYNNIFGMIIMSICLGIYLTAYLLGRKIVEVEV